MWTGYHSKEHEPTETVYFDAFKHDYMDTPLLSLTAEVVERLERDETTKGKAVVEGLKKYGILGSKLALRVGAAVASGGTSEPLVAIATAGADAATQEIDKLWKAEEGRRAAMERFRNALVTATDPDANKDPQRKLVIVVDELDRCRPDYALNLLEIIKHFFDVKGVHFILGVNLEQLENSVKARYGEGIDAGRYLQRFYDLKMSLELPKRKADSLFEYFTKTFAAPISNNHPYFAEAKNFVLLLDGISQVELRDLNRFAAKLTFLPEYPEDYRQSPEFSRASRLCIVLMSLLDTLQPDSLFKGAKAASRIHLATHCRDRIQLDHNKAKSSGGKVDFDFLVLATFLDESAAPALRNHISHSETSQIAESLKIQHLFETYILPFQPTYRD